MTHEPPETSASTSPVSGRATPRRFRFRRVLRRLALLLVAALLLPLSLWLAGWLYVARHEESNFRSDGMDCHLYYCRLVLDIRRTEITLAGWESWDHRGHWDQPGH